MAENSHTKCPTCGKPPIMERFRSSYWIAKCPAEHLTPVAGHPMRTQRDAWSEWEKAYGHKSRLC